MTARHHPRRLHVEGGRVYADPSAQNERPMKTENPSGPQTTSGAAASGGTTARSAADHRVGGYGTGIEGANPDTLTHAVSLRRLDVIRDWVARGADLDAADADGVTPMGCAILMGFHDVLDELVAAGACLDGHAGQGDPPLLVAVQTAALGPPRSLAVGLAMIRHLLARGVDLAARDSNGFNALTLAALLDLRPVLGVLLRAGAPPDLPAADGRTPLMVASTPATVHRLLRAGAHPMTRDQAGLVALHHAAAAGRLPLLERLLPVTPIEVIDAAGMTALMHAARHDHAAAVCWLLMQGADLEPVDGTGAGAIDHAWHAFAATGVGRALATLDQSAARSKPLQDIRSLVASRPHLTARNLPACFTRLMDAAATTTWTRRS